MDVKVHKHIRINLGLETEELHLLMRALYFPLGGFSWMPTSAEKEQLKAMTAKIDRATAEADI